ncbi:hypothetical protein TH61_12720 [Rufibacter sp. DG15C]|uniref:glycosyltransferase family 2 protein n=1 Tax=Rufibacter sp. DG15C TaxID=1379909 RepID=UPI00078D64F7|nr:glycosyltransferase family 2 protein [Rufibacter sp. DG15C]AMM51866.1 hypothetical protein TH61_12720 [Rufibacter sp. DG15C]
MESRVAIITGFYKSPNFLKELFKSLNKQSYRLFDVYIYNYELNEFDVGLIADINFNYHLLNLPKNVGFAGGNNAAIKAAKQVFDYSFYALINDDTKPDKDWLLNLVSKARERDEIGVVTSKLVFYERFLLVQGDITSENQPHNQIVEARFYNNSCFENCWYPKKFFLEGFGNEEEDEIFTFRSIGPKFQVCLPVATCDLRLPVKLRLYIKCNSEVEDQVIKLRVGSFYLPEFKLQKDKIFYELTIPETVFEKDSFMMVQNAGSDVDEQFNGYDIGSGQIDKGQFDAEREVKMFCGGACLISKVALEKVGLFEELYFSYYEDSDLSFRIRNNGFKIVYNPKALVWHYHSATSVEWSPFFTYHVFRNKLIFAFKNIGIKAFVASYLDRINETWYFVKFGYKIKFSDPALRSRIKLNFNVLKDSVSGIIRYNPTKF